MRARRPQVFLARLKQGNEEKSPSRGRESEGERREEGGTSGHILAAQVTFRVRATRDQMGRSNSASSPKCSRRKQRAYARKREIQRWNRDGD